MALGRKDAERERELMRERIRIALLGLALVN